MSTNIKLNYKVVLFNLFGKQIQFNWKSKKFKQIKQKTFIHYFTVNTCNFFLRLIIKINQINKISYINKKNNQRRKKFSKDLYLKLVLLNNDISILICQQIQFIYLHFVQEKRLLIRSISYLSSLTNLINYKQYKIVIKTITVVQM